MPRLSRACSIAGACTILEPAREPGGVQARFRLSVVAAICEPLVPGAPDGPPPQYDLGLYLNDGDTYAELLIGTTRPLVALQEQLAEARPPEDWDLLAVSGPGRAQHGRPERPRQMAGLPRTAPVDVGALFPTGCRPPRPRGRSLPHTR